MICLTMLSIIFIYILLTGLFRRNYKTAILIVEFIYLIISINYTGMRTCICNLNLENFLFFLLGYCMSPIIIIVIYTIVFLKIPHIKFSIHIRMEILLGVLIEELIWRHLLLFWVDTLKLTFFQTLQICFVVMFLFVLSHSQINGYRNGIEMFCFSIVLVFMAYFFPGMNIGLHLGRDICIKNFMDKKGI